MGGRGACAGVFSNGQKDTSLCVTQLHFRTCIFLRLLDWRIWIRASTRVFTFYTSIHTFTEVQNVSTFHTSATIASCMCIALYLRMTGRQEVHPIASSGGCPLLPAVKVTFLMLIQWRFRKQRPVLCCCHGRRGLGLGEEGLEDHTANPDKNIPYVEIQTRWVLRHHI